MSSYNSSKLSKWIYAINFYAYGWSYALVQQMVNEPNANYPINVLHLK